MDGRYERHLLLPGQRFCPMEDELLMYYLKPKVNGMEVPGKEALICEIDLYGDQEPWDIWEKFKGRRANDLRKNKDLYFFTKKKKVSAKASRIKRKVGDGTWKGQDATKGIYLVDDRNQQPTTTLLGFKKTYTYKNTGSNDHNGRWIMYEFELDESQVLHRKQANKNEYVLCLLRKNDIQAEKKRRRQEEGDESLQDYVEDEDGDFKNIPELAIEEPLEKRLRLLTCVDDIASPSSLQFDEALQQWLQQFQQLEFKQEEGQTPILEAEPVEPQPLQAEAADAMQVSEPMEENLGQQCQMLTTTSANETMSHNNVDHQDQNMVHQMPAEKDIVAPAGKVDPYGGNKSDVMVDTNWSNSFMADQIKDEQPNTMGVAAGWYDNYYSDYNYAF